MSPAVVEMQKQSKCIWINQITDICVVKAEPDLNLEEACCPKTFRMRLTAVRDDTEKEAVDADKTVSMNANIMKEDIEKYAELTEVYIPSLSWDILAWNLLALVLR